MRRRLVLAGAAGLLARPAVGAAAALSPVGAETSGNAAGTIPAYDGGLLAISAGVTDPFATDPPYAVLRAADAGDPRLTPGHAALLRARPGFYMRLLPTRRSAHLPDFIAAASAANLGRARLTEPGTGVIGAATGIPFPRPNNGLQVIWNHMLRWRFQALQRNVGAAAPLASGAFTRMRVGERTLYPYNTPGLSPVDVKGLPSQLLMYRILEPAAYAGIALLSRQPLDFATDRTLYWFFSPALRRVVLSAETVFDAPVGAADGLRTVDQADMFAGSPERYDWQLLGKREAIVPYNSYALYDRARRYEDIVRPGALAPQLARYELHRVWVVDARLRPGSSHRYVRRVCYFDEDSWQMLLAEHYDASGALVRVSEAHPIQYTTPVPSFYAAIDVSHDLPSGRYSVFGLPNEDPPIDPQPRLSAATFTPDGLRAYAGR